MTEPGAKRRAVSLDRDGVLNRSHVRDGKPFAPLRLEDFDILPGVADAVGDLKAAGFLVVVTTNQKDIGEGLVSMDVLEAMHDKLRAAVAVDDICVCTCGDHCRRYKPNPGMLLDAARQWDIDLAASIMVGDRWRDVDAGRPPVAAPISSTAAMPSRSITPRITPSRTCPRPFAIFSNPYPFEWGPA